MTATTQHPLPVTAPPSAAPAADRRARKAARRRQLTACGVLMTPFFALLVTVFLIPVGTAVYLSFYSDDQPGLGFGPERTVFVGLRSYAAVLTDPTFLGGLGTVALYCLIYIPLMVVGALALALLLDSGVVKLRAWAQLGLFLPHAVPGIIAALIWLYLYTPGLSPVVSAMHSGGIGFDFFSPGGALPSIVNIALWEWLGYNMVIFYAALQAIDRSVLEAATVDGASGGRIAFSIKLPLIRSSVLMVVLFTIIGSLQLFTEPLILNTGSGSAVSSSWTPNMYAYTAAF